MIEHSDAFHLLLSFMFHCWPTLLKDGSNGLGSQVTFSMVIIPEMDNNLVVGVSNHKREYL